MIMSFNSNRTGATEGLGTAYPLGAHEFTLGFLGVHIAQSLVLYVVFVNHFLFFFVLRFTASNYPFGSFKHFLRLDRQERS